jgi:hypothetical protein
VASASFDLSDPVFEAFGVCFSVQVETLANRYGIDLAQTSAREEEPAFVVRAAALLRADGRSRAPGAVVLRIEPEAGGSLSVRLRAKAPEPIRSTTLLLRGLATPLALMEGKLALEAIALLPGAPKRTPTAAFLLHCDDARLAVRVGARSVGETSAAVGLERGGDRSGQGVLALVHACDASSLAREHEAPACEITRV